MFRYIDMPKLVAFYLREFSYRADGAPSNLYKFIFSLCLPFVSFTFRKARLNALAIAECTNSQDQITRVLKKITGADMVIDPLSLDYYAPFNGTGESPDFPYNGSNAAANTPLVLYSPVANAGVITITLNGAPKAEVIAYLELLIPFYIQTTITYR